MRFVAALALWVATALPSAADITLGVLAPQGVERAEARWTPFFELLEQRLGTRVHMYPVSAMDGTDAFIAHAVDFMLGNPVQTAVVVDTMGAVPVASMIKPSGSQFAGVIVVDANSSIRELGDLRGARLATLGMWAAGGYLFQANHLVENGYGLPDDLGRCVLGPNQTALVQMVLDGEAEAAFIRTGVLEDLVAQGLVAEGDLRVLDDLASGEGDLHRTTEWYPEWAMVAHPSVSEWMIQDMRNVLMDLPADNPALVQARVVGFQEPLDSSPVVRAMRRVGIPPYN